jgi:RHS repeat-associated protein
MTTIPKPGAPANSYAGTYDAWNRLVKVADGSSTVAEYEYDGLNRRIVKSIYSGGSLDHRQHFYYNEDWQVQEVRKETSGTEDPDPLEQFIWHPNYIDAPALRFYDAATSGSQTIHYYTYDANYNVTALLSGNTPIERYRYSPYGAVTVLDADFSVDADGKSDIGNSCTYTGRQIDWETGLFYYRNRYYHPQLGNFVSRDPIGYDAGDLNLYRYVGSRPTNLVDPSGTAVLDNPEEFEDDTPQWLKDLCAPDPADFVCPLGGLGAKLGGKAAKGLKGAFKACVNKLGKLFGKGGKAAEIAAAEKALAEATRLRDWWGATVGHLGGEALEKAEERIDQLDAEIQRLTEVLRNLRGG